MLLEWYLKWRLAHCAPVVWVGLWFQQSFPHVKCMMQSQGHSYEQSMPKRHWCQCTSWSLGPIKSVSVCGYWWSRYREVVVTPLSTIPLKSKMECWHHLGYVHINMILIWVFSLLYKYSSVISWQYFDTYTSLDDIVLLNINQVWSHTSLHHTWVGS